LNAHVQINAVFVGSIKTMKFNAQR